jgi:hypothetical protein
MRLRIAESLALGLTPLALMTVTKSALPPAETYARTDSSANTDNFVSRRYGNTSSTVRSPVLSSFSGTGT